MFHWMQFLTYAVITAATPGPNTLMSMSNGGRLGFRKAFPFNLGILVGFQIVTLLCTGLGSLLHRILPSIKTPMLFIGAAYMLYLAWKTFRSTGEFSASGAKSGFLSGLLLQFVNPKIYLYCIVSLEAYILPYYHGQPVKLVAFAALLSFIGFFFTVCWSAFGSLFKVLFSKHGRVTNTVMALLLVYCAISLFL